MLGPQRRPVNPHSYLSLNPIQLLEYTRFIAGEVSAARYPYVRYDRNVRWHQRIYRDPRVDVWLISWLPTQGTQLHDHGGSSGAFTVLSGELNEAIHAPGQRRARRAKALAEQRRTAGEGIGFGPRYVHDVRNLSDSPALSVHAYSPPLVAMNYYDLDARGGLVHVSSLITDDPEPANLPARGTPAA